MYGLFVAERYFVWIPYHNFAINFIEAFRGVICILGGALMLFAESYTMLRVVPI
jgi:hypothetical protein